MHPAKAHTGPYFLYYIINYEEIVKKCILFKISMEKPESLIFQYFPESFG
jgi:hypothetical protein